MVNAVDSDRRSGSGFGPNDIPRLFQEADEDGNSIISAAEFSLWAKRTKLPMGIDVEKSEDIDAIFKFADMSGDGQIEYSEWNHFIYRVLIQLQQGFP